MGLMSATSFNEGSTVKGLIAMGVELVLGTVGIDLQTGTNRFTFGNPNLMDGIDFLVLALGLFSLAEVFWEATHRDEAVERIPLKNPFPTWRGIKESFGAMMRGSFIGLPFGVLPGVGAATSSFVSYAVEKQVSKDPGKFGQGAIEGVAAPRRPTTGRPRGPWSISCRWGCRARGRRR